MNAFAEASTVERQGLAVLLPYLERQAWQGRLVSTAGRGAACRALQRSFGDFLLNTDAATLQSIEVKIERRWTGNLFLETWSNRNLEDPGSHAERGSNPGWMVTSRADILLYYFLDSDDLVSLPMLTLKRWAFGSGHAGGIYGWPERRQRRYAQMNDTWGRCVPVAILEHEAGASVTKAQQLATAAI